MLESGVSRANAFLKPNKDNQNTFVSASPSHSKTSGRRRWTADRWAGLIGHV